MLFDRIRFDPQTPPQLKRVKSLLKRLTGDPIPLSSKSFRTVMSRTRPSALVLPKTMLLKIFIVEMPSEPKVRTPVKAKPLGLSGVSKEFDANVLLVTVMSPKLLLKEAALK